MTKHSQLIALGKNIRKLRENRGFSQEAFADHAGLDRSYYGAIERGERNISVRSLLKIAHALGIEASELLVKNHRQPKKSKTQ